ncbi:MAG: hypothetical protein LWW86_04730 [Micrococcales bacterium]|nr:hypothetical protein [Micrococcales bacterium]
MDAPNTMDFEDDFEFDDDYRDAGLESVLAASEDLNDRLNKGRYEGARNVISKAITALESGDQERADRMIRLAAKQPWTEGFGEFPGIAEAGWALFQELMDAIEASAQDTSSWLDDAFAVLSTATGPSRYELTANLSVLGQAPETFDVTPHEARQLRRRIKEPSRSDKPVFREESTIEEREQYIRAVLETAVAFHTRHWHGEE